MASKPNPSWSEPQKRVHKDIQEGMEIVVPYFGPEIPVLDNNTPEQLCDMLGVVKAGKAAFEKVEKILKERFKPKMPKAAAGADEVELRGTRYVATLRTNPRVAIDQGKVKELIATADEAGINIERLIAWAITQSREAGDLPERVWAYNPTETNTLMLNSQTEVETLNVKAI